MEDFVYSEQIDQILCQGMSLERIGVRNWGLTRAEALLAAATLGHMGVAILGGDVYCYGDGALRSSPDSWYCDPNNGESNVDYIARSIDTARSFISGQSTSGETLLFALVPCDRSGQIPC